MQQLITEMSADRCRLSGSSCPGRWPWWRRKPLVVRLLQSNRNQFLLVILVIHGVGVLHPRLWFVLLDGCGMEAEKSLIGGPDPYLLGQFERLIQFQYDDSRPAANPTLSSFTGTEEVHARSSGALRAADRPFAGAVGLAGYDYGHDDSIGVRAFDIIGRYRQLDLLAGHGAGGLDLVQEHE